MTVYLDHNATSPMLASVIDAMTDVFSVVGNASSMHKFGRDARTRVEAARRDVARLVGAEARDVIFTGGGTEANNLALAGVSGVGRRLIVSETEHASVLQFRDDVEVVSVTASGQVDLESLEKILSSGAPALVSIMAANNETGAIQPLAKISAIVHTHGGMLHSDFIQAAGRIELDLKTLGVDLATLSAHKIGGPQGVGALVLSRELAPAPLLRGGGQEHGHRAGTENVAGIAGFGVAAQLARDAVTDAGSIAQLRDEMETQVLDRQPGAVVIGRLSERLPNTSCIAAPGVKAATQVMGLDLAGVAVSAGSACSSGKVQSSHVLHAMGYGPGVADCAIRVSLGRDTTPEDINRFVTAWDQVIARAMGAQPSKGRVKNA